MGTNGVGRMGGQEDLDGGDPQMGTDGGSGKRQKCKNMMAEGKQRKIANSKITISMGTNQPIHHQPRFLPICIMNHDCL